MTTILPEKYANTICLEQQIYASPENFTPVLLVMLETSWKSTWVISCTRKGSLRKFGFKWSDV